MLSAVKDVKDVKYFTTDYLADWRNFSMVLID